MKTLIVEITDKSKNDFVLELLGSFSYLNVKEKKDLNSAEKKLIKKYKKAFNESDVNPGKKKKPNLAASLPTEL